jgi:[ribosomal protein S18]-alanine N-acetyltransferase
VEPRIRNFQSEDFEALWRIDQLCFAPGISYSRPELAAYIRMPGSFTLVAERVLGPADKREISPANGAISGFVVAHANRQGAGHIITIDVLPEARRHGLGSRLLSAAEARLREDSCTMVRLETAVDNISALAFYKRHQYNLVRTIPRYYPGGVDALVLRKNLLSPAPADKLHP